MKNTYYIDSENVGNNWTALLHTIADDDEILVFYTSKSPNMSYKNVILLRESTKDIKFIECFEGNNALDFQLCTELGFRINTNHDREFIIVSNDTGYDAVVKYWRQKEYPVKRIPGKACLTVSTPARKQVPPQETEIIVPVSVPDSVTQPLADSAVDLAADAAAEPLFDSVTDVLSDSVTDTMSDPASDSVTDTMSDSASDALSDSVADAMSDSASDALSDSMTDVLSDSADVPFPARTENEPVMNTEAEISEMKPEAETIDPRAKELLYLIGKDNLQNLHEALQQLFDAKKATEWYNALKSEEIYDLFLQGHVKMDSIEKQRAYCKIVFELSETKLDMPDDFPEFLTKSWNKKKNLNSFRSALQEKYGKKKSEKYYALIKAHVKIITKIQ